MKEPNILRIKARGGSYYEQDIILNNREGIEIIGNYELISYRIDGIMRPLH